MKENQTEWIAPEKKILRFLFVAVLLVATTIILAIFYFSALGHSQSTLSKKLLWHISFWSIMGGLVLFKKIVGTYRTELNISGDKLNLKSKNAQVVSIELSEVIRDDNRLLIGKKLLYLGFGGINCYNNRLLMENIRKVDKSYELTKLALARKNHESWLEQIWIVYGVILLICVIFLP